MTRSPGLRRQLLSGVALIIFVTTLSVGGLTFYATRAQITEIKLEHGRFLGQSVANLLVDNLKNRTDGQPALLRFVSTIANTSMMRGLVVVDAHLNILAATPHPSPESRLLDPELLAAIRTRHQRVNIVETKIRLMSVSTPIMDGGQLLGAVRLQTNLGTEQLSWPTLFWILMSIDGLFLFLFVALVHTRYVIQPIQAMQLAAEKVRGGDLSVQLPQASTFELASLARSFNTMTSSVQEQLLRLDQQRYELAVSREQLIRSEKLASVGRLAAGVAHEVGNPLQVIIGFTEMILSKQLQPEEAEDFLSRIRSEAQRIHRIIRDLLDYARPVDDAIEPVDLASVVEQSIQLIKPQKRYQGVNLDRAGLEGLPPVAANGSRLVQVLVNLLLNAIDAMKGTGTVQVEGVRSEPEQSISLRVANTGPPISLEDRDRIFDPFFTTKEPGQGTGLGLSIAQSIVESYHGTLTLINNEVLTTFVIVLPVWSSPSAGSNETA